jgi:protein-disulfide isomerase
MAETPTRKQQREVARAERKEREAKAARDAAMKKRLGIIGAIVAVAVVLVVILVVATGGSNKKQPEVATAGEAVPGQTRTAALLKGIPQKGRFLGDPKAPVTLVEFADLQCPFCLQYTEQALPTVIAKYVRTGKVRLEFRPRAFIGPDSEKAARIVVSAGAENKLWNTLELFYASQGQENGGWVTDALVNSVVKAVGLDPAKVTKGAQAPSVSTELKDADLLATRNGLDSTPAFLIGKTGGKATPLQAQALTGAFFSKALDQALGA